MEKKKIILGWIIIILGAAAVIASGFVSANTENKVLELLSPVACGIFGGCLVVGVGFIRRGRSPKANRQYEVEQHDERNIAIRGKAAYITFFLLLLLTLAFSSYIFYIQKDTVLGFVGYGIVCASLVIYVVLYAVYNKKL